jgi:hypothetical protein
MKKAVAWEAAAEAEELPAHRIEEARQNTVTAYREMQEAARSLLICMPTDPKALVDLLLYMEKNFSVLPQEISHGASTGHSLAFDLLRTVRLSLREIARYGKYGTDVMKRRRRSIKKRNRQRLAVHAKRLRR